MSFKKSLALFAIFMFAGGSAYVAARNDFYPVAVANWDIITAKELKQSSATAYRYFQNALLASRSDPQQLDTLENQKEIRRAALDKLISDVLIRRELNARFKGEYQAIAERNINAFVGKNQNLEQGTRLLYGLEFSDFKNQVLVPQAYREILEGRMFLNNENFDDWLVKKRGLARVIIFTPDLEWDNGAVKLRN